MEKTKAEIDIKSITWVVYALQAVSLFFGITSIIGLIINLWKSSAARESELIDAHFRWQIRTFWWSLVWMLLGIVLSVFFVGIFIMIGAACWYVYRIIRGMMTFSEGKLPKPGY